MRKIIILLFCFVSGCISQKDIDYQLTRCPKYVQDNVGVIKYQPLNPFGFLGLQGATHKPTGRVVLFILADKHTVIHEIAHSVYFRVEHGRFTYEFDQQSGFISIYAIGLYEEIAEAFVEGMKGRSNPKIDLAMKFFNGGYEKALKGGER